MNRLQKDASFLKAFENAFEGAAPFPSAQQHSVQSRKRQDYQGFGSLYPKSIKLTKDAFELVARFEELEGHIQRINAENLRDDQWHEQDVELMEVLAAGRDIGIKKCNFILAAKSREEETIEEDDQRFRTIANRQLFSEELGNLNGSTGAWGKAVKTQSKAVKKLVRTVTVVSV